MRQSLSLLVLATIAATNVVAMPSGHAHQHAHHHAKKEAAPLEEPVKRDAGLADVDWNAISYTYSKGQTWGQPTQAPANAQPAASVPTAAPKAAPAAPAANDKVAAKKPASSPASSSGSSGSSSAGSKSGGDANGGLLSGLHLDQLTQLGFKALGQNAKTSNGQAWLGGDGAYTNEFTNDAEDDLVLVVWGSDASWVNAKQPLVTVTIPKGKSQTLSFANGASGAWAAMHSDTVLKDGQVHNTWGEYTFSPYGVVDVSREVNMNGHAMSIQGPTCTSDMEKCVFVCPSGDSCMTGYQLKNCSPSSQSGAQDGTDNGAPSGGCGGLGNSANLKTSLQ